MLSRSSFGRQAQRALQRQCRAQPANRRGLAAPASGSFNYDTGDASGIKYASRDMSGPTTTLALVSKAGTRYQYLPGLTEGLEKYAYRGTERRSALRIVREAELLGAELQTTHSRESLIVGAKFLRDDLPYFVELLAEVATKTKYLPHVYHEEVMPLIALAHKKFLASTKEMALSSVHGLAFHRGLGTPLYPSSSTPYTKYLDADTIKEFASAAYAKGNFAIVANGAEHSDLSKWVGEFFTDVPSSGAQSLQSPQTKYYGGEERIAHGSGNTMVLAFPGSSSYTGGFYKPEIAVLAALLGGESSIKWSTGFSLLSKAAFKHPGVSVQTKSAIYSDAGLLYVVIHGSAKQVAGTAQEVVKTIKSIAGGEISKEDITKARAMAKFKELEHGQTIMGSLELTGAGLVQGGKPYQLDETAKAIDGVTEDQVKKAAKSLLDYRASVSSVGDLFQLPFAEELGLKV
ncbi:ubiquinol-cytochrome c reductase core subunit 1 [Coniosporium apollinis]|uniref:Cytochrome b-c1 complex subunit 2, mitochondrial n=2 Tax=Coniosporium TaxID=2810619 RepID=A0ABQ9NVU7_9PEZI|nr:ubiquinol-cytochrome c reductase core subunit 1 [Cladosporium sp. JES 115]KAJ9665440.1 ubiquinol-cytochrome c reductase core subunit 1 [Coniosporium apollinis]